MKIDPKKSIGLYEAQNNKNLKNDSVVKQQANTKAGAAKKDRIEFSQKGVKHGEVLSMKAELVNEIEKGADTKKLESIKVQIQNGTYSVSSSDIASAILKTKS